MTFVAIVPKLLRTPEELATATGPDLVLTFNALTGQNVKRFKSPAAGRRRVEAAMMAAKEADGRLGVPKGQEPQVRTLAELEEKARSKGQHAPDMSGAAVDEGSAEEDEANAVQEEEQSRFVTGNAAAMRAELDAQEPQEAPETPAASAGTVEAAAPQEGPVAALGEGVPMFPPETLAGQLQAQAAKVAPIVAKPQHTRPELSPTDKKIRRRLKFVRVAATPGASKVRAASSRGIVLAFLKALPVDAAGRPGHISFEELAKRLEMPDAVVHVHKLAFFDHVELCNVDGVVPEPEKKAAPAARDEMQQFGTPGEEH